MPKDCYYFSHDSNAKDDPKCILLIEQLGPEGYGIFWILIETLRDQPDHKYPLNLIPAIARRFNTTTEKVSVVVKNYKLFIIENEEFFHSESLNSRMLLVDQKREKTRFAGIISGQKRKLLNDSSTDAEQTFNGCSTDDEQLKESKLKESKLKEKKDRYITAQHLSITETEYMKLTNKFGKEVVDAKIEYAQNYAKLKNFISLYLILNGWLKKDNIPIDESPKEPVKLNIIYREFEER